MSELTIMSQNVQKHAVRDGRWSKIIKVIRSVGPQILFLQEVDFLTDEDQKQAAEEALGMKLMVAPSRQLNTAVAWDPSRLDHVDTETMYSTTDMHHGYCALQFQPRGLKREWPAPLVAISTHLTPYSTNVAADEARLLIARV